MAMLAEPRQRKRYNLQPKGKALYEDESRFGTKMLEKMGWKKGQGLGPNESGLKDFIRIRYKNDALGLGFEERDDQWVQHEQNFNGLLQTLNNVDAGSNLSMEKEISFQTEGTDIKDKVQSKVTNFKNEISGVSLEERSKQSKNRVHYKKFTRGKDLVQYSEKDLANIFGKKALDDQQQVEYDLFKNLNNTFEENPNVSNGQTINTGISINDYFKDKMERRQNPENVNIENTHKASSDEAKLEENPAKKKKDLVLEEHKNRDQKSEPNVTYSDVSVTDYFKIKMDAMRNKKSSVPNQQVFENNDCDQEQKEDFPRKRKKNKKDIDDVLIEPARKNNDCDQEQKEEIPKKKKKNKKDIDIVIEPARENNDCDQEQKEEIAKKKKKNKKDIDIIIEPAGENNDCDQEQKKEIPKKKKKNKKDIDIIIEPAREDNDCDQEQKEETAKKKKKNKKDIDIIIEPARENNDCDQERKEEIAKKKKKNKKDIEDPLLEPAKKKSKKQKYTADMQSGDIIETQNVATFIEEQKPLKTGKEGIEIDSIGEMKSKKKKDKLKSKPQLLSQIDNDTTTTISDIPELELTQSNIIDLTQKQEKTKKKKTKTSDTNEIIVLTDDDNNSVDDKLENQKEKQKKKSKSTKESTENASNVSVLPVINQSEKVADNSATSKKSTRNAKNIYTNDVNLEELDIEEVERQYKAFDVYPISSFSAEKFRNINLDCFVGSSLPHLEGYGLSSDIQLEVQVNKNDEERITNLWKCVLNKYIHVDKPKKTYQHYIREVIAARKIKQKAPNLYVKTWKRKNAFQII